MEEAVQQFTVEEVKQMLFEEQVSGDDAGIYGMKARFCDVYYINTKTVYPATLKQLNYQVD